MAVRCHRLFDSHLDWRGIYMSWKLFAQIATLMCMFFFGLWQVMNPLQPQKDEAITFIRRPAPTVDMTPKCDEHDAGDDIVKQAVQNHQHDDFDTRRPVETRMILKQDMVTGGTRYQIISVIDDEFTLEEGLYLPKGDTDVHWSSHFGVANTVHQ